MHEINLPRPTTGFSHIYGLICPRTEAIRYIGKANDLHRRRSYHQKVVSGSRSRLQAWVADLRAEGLLPVMVLLEGPFPIDQWREREQAWIATYQDAGADLINIHEGGNGTTSATKYWNAETIRSATLELIADLNLERFPTVAEFNQAGFGGLYKAIQTSDGGTPAMAASIGFEQKYKGTRKARPALPAYKPIEPVLMPDELQQRQESERSRLREDAVKALRRAALKTPREYLSPHRYRQATKDDAHSELCAPVTSSIISEFGGWHEALLYAGISVDPIKKETPSVEHILDLIYDIYAVEPTISESQLFARSNGLPYPRLSRPWGKIVQDWKAGRSSKGLPVPDGRPPKRLRPDYANPVLQGSGRMARWNESDARSAMVAFVQDADCGQWLSFRNYIDWAVSKPNRPSINAIHRFGFIRLRDEALLSSTVVVERHRAGRVKVVLPDQLKRAASGPAPFGP